MSAPMKINLPYVTTRQNADGSLRYYYDRRGYPLVRLTGDPLSAEFMAAYEAAPTQQPVAHGKRGSFGWMCDTYLDSPDFKNLKPATISARRRIIATMLAERINPAHRHTFAVLPMADFTRKHIIVLRDRKAAVPNAANERLKILSQIFKAAIDVEIIDTNPVSTVAKLKTRTGGHATATDAQINTYMAHHTSGPERLAMRLLMAFGCRVSDLRRLGRHNIKDGWLHYTTQKTNMAIEVQIPADLLPELLASPHMVFLLTDHGKPFASEKAMSAKIARCFRQAGIEGITAHSVRKWAATKDAEASWDDRALCAKYGWRDSKEARPYTEAVNRRKLVEMATEKEQAANVVRPRWD